jgi:hypothetical protein
MLQFGSFNCENLCETEGRESGYSANRCINMRAAGRAAAHARVVNIRMKGLGSPKCTLVNCPSGHASRQCLVSDDSPSRSNFLYVLNSVPLVKQCFRRDELLSYSVTAHWEVRSFAYRLATWGCRTMGLT